MWVTEKEIEDISNFLGITIKEFAQKFVRYVDGKYSLREKSGNGEDHDCIFLKDKRCQIYPVRPKQCRTFPWWPRHLKTEEDWSEAALWCEGINHPEAPMIPLNVIQEQLAIQEDKSYG